VLFTLPGSLEVALRAAGEVGMARERVVLLEGAVEGVRSLWDLVEEGRKGKVVEEWSIPDGDSNRDVCG
jgi:4-coumarate--CoA ligase